MENLRPAASLPSSGPAGIAENCARVAAAYVTAATVISSNSVTDSASKTRGVSTHDGSALCFRVITVPPIVLCDATRSFRPGV